MKTYVRILILLGILLIGNQSYAQTASATWALTASGAPATVGHVTASTIVPSPAANMVGFFSGCTFGSTTPAGMKIGVTSIGGWAAEGLTTVATSSLASIYNSATLVTTPRYLQFTIAPTAGYNLNINNISVSVMQNNSSSTIQCAAAGYSTDGVSYTTFNSSGLAGNILPTNTGANLNKFTVFSATPSLAINSSNTITVRVVLWRKGSSSAASTSDILGPIVISGTESVASSPVISATPSSLSFGSLQSGSSTASQSISVTGFNLTNDITVTPPTGFEIRTGSNAFSTSPITLTQVSGSVSATVDARFSPLTAATFSSNITFVSSGATTQNVAVTGSSSGIFLNTSSFVNAFGSAAVGTSSGTSSFSILGNGLTNDIVITPPTGFEIRTGSNAFSTSPVTLTQAGGNVSSTTIDVRFTPLTSANFSANVVCSSVGSTSQNVAVTGTSVGTITLNTSSFTGAFGYAKVGNSTASSSFTVSGAILGADIVVTPPTGFEIKLSSDAIFSTSPITLTQTAGTVNTTTIDARFSPLTSASFSGNIACTSTGSTTQNAAVSGTSMVSTIATGNWSSTSIWNTGELPSSTDNIIISSGHTITIDDANAVCQNLSFGASTSHIVLGSASSVLSVYGNFTYFATTHQVFTTWTAGAKLKFTGSAATQNISGLPTSGSSLFGLMEIVVDKSAGKVATLGNNYRIPLGSSLEVINGTFELGSADDIMGFDIASALTAPTITIQSGGTFRFIGGATQINTGSTGTSGTGYNPIGKMTIYGTVEMVTTSTGKIAIGGIDVENGGVLRLLTGWGASNPANGYFCPGVLTVKSGGQLDCYFNTLAVWSPIAGATSLVLNSGSTVLSNTATSFALPASTTDNGATFKYSLAGAQTSVLARAYTNLEISGGGAKTLGGNITVNGTLSLNEGLLELGAFNLTLGSSAVISGTPTATNMIVTNGAGTVIKSIADAQTLPYSFTFPVGEITGTTEYSPVSVTVNSGTLSTASIDAKVVNTKHASNASVADFTNRYWAIASTGITGGSFSLNGTYLPADVVGNESNMITSGYASGSWTNYSLVNATTHSIIATGVASLGDFTAITAPVVTSGNVIITFIPEGYYRSDVDPLPISDVFTATLASATGPDYADVETVNVKIDSVTYTGTATFVTAPSGNYYLYVKGIALMATWSASAIAFEKGSTVSYDFTDAVTKAYAIPGFPFEPMVLQGTKWCIYDGDVDQDELIGNVDLTMIDNDAFVTLEVHGATDLDGDALVGNVDLTICDNHAFWVVESQTPRKVGGMASKYLHKPVLNRTVKIQN